MNWDMLKGWEHEGVFWLPNNDTDRVEGKVVYAPGESLSLKLAKSLPTGSTHAFGLNQNPTILGRLVGGALITLLETFDRTRTYGSGANGSVDVVVNKALIGSAIDDVRIVRFEKAYVRLTQLESFFGRRSIQLENVSSALDGRGLLVKYREPNPIEISVPQRRLSLRVQFGLQSSSTYTSLQMQEYAQIAVESETPRSLDDWLVVGEEVRTLHCLLSGESMFVRTLTLAVTPGEGIQCGVDKAATFVAVHQSDPPAKERLPPMMLIPFANVEDQYGSLVTNWLSTNELFRPALQLFFAAAEERASPLEFKFLAMTQAMEAFHRARDGGTYLPPHQYEMLLPELIASIPAAIKGDHRNSVKSRLQYANEFSQRKRFSLIYAGLPPQVRAMLLGTSDRFVDHVIETRNHLTHLGPTDGRRVYEGSELLYAYERLRVTFHALLLLQIGLIEDVVVERFNQDDRTRWVLSKDL